MRFSADEDDARPERGGANALMPRADVGGCALPPAWVHVHGHVHDHDHDAHRRGGARAHALALRDRVRGRVTQLNAAPRPPALARCPA